MKTGHDDEDYNYKDKNYKKPPPCDEGYENTLLSQAQQFNDDYHDDIDE